MVDEECQVIKDILKALQRRLPNGDRHYTVSLTKDQILTLRELLEDIPQSIDNQE